MKLLVFAHTPPPHHGQSYMVKLLLDGLHGDPAKGNAPAQAVECYHVNCRFSDEMEDIGEIQAGKIWLLLRYCIQAIWCRFRHGVEYFYYVPAPGKRAALYRDWIIMLLCRPFFKEIIFHWHAVGLGDWLQREGLWIEKFLTRRLLRHADLSIVLAISSMRDALWFETRRLEIVPNGIPDPCPDFEQNILPYRLARVRERTAPVEDSGIHVFKLLYLAHCTRKKGLFDTLEAVALANAATESGIRVHLTVAGAFLDAAEEKEFHQRILRDDLKESVTYAGFVSGGAKEALLRSSDCLCFPTYYEAEGQPVNIIEAMAFGLSVITTRWRAIPEILPPGHACFVSPQAPQEIAMNIRHFFNTECAKEMRLQFTTYFTETRYIQLIKHALREESPQSAPSPVI